MTMLCRAAGLPARLATGFAPGEQDGQTYNLRALDKHAWTEVYFPGEGWLAFDPTAGDADGRFHPHQDGGAFPVGLAAPSWAAWGPCRWRCPP